MVSRNPGDLRDLEHCCTNKPSGRVSHLRPIPKITVLECTICLKRPIPRICLKRPLTTNGLARPHELSGRLSVWSEVCDKRSSLTGRRSTLYKTLRARFGGTALGCDE